MTLTGIARVMVAWLPFSTPKVEPVLAAAGRMLAAGAVSRFWCIRVAWCMADSFAARVLLATLWCAFRCRLAAGIAFVTVFATSAAVLVAPAVVVLPVAPVPEPVV